MEGGKKEEGQKAGEEGSGGVERLLPLHPPATQGRMGARIYPDWRHAH